MADRYLLENGTDRYLQENGVDFYLLDTANPLMETLSDDFNDNSTDTAKWATFATNTTVTETGGQVSFTTSTVGSGYAGYDSQIPYSLVGSYASVQLVNAGNQALTKLEVPFSVIKDASNRVWYLVSGGILGFYTTVGGSQTKIGQVTYDSTAHQYLRIRESSGRTYWDTSPDGAKWTNQIAAANVFDMKAVTVELSVGTWGVEATSTTVVYDNFNVFPTGISLIPRVAIGDGNAYALGAPLTVTSGLTYLVTVNSRTAVSVDPLAPTISGLGITWTQIATAQHDTTSSSRKRITMYQGVASSTATGTILADFAGVVQTDIGLIVDEFIGVDTTTPIVQSATNVDATITLTTLAATLAAFGSTNNATYGSFGIGSTTSGYTPGTGFGYGADVSTVTTNRLVSEFRPDNDTTVDMAFTAAEEIGVIAVEIKASTGGSTVTKTQTATASIAKTVTKTQPATARIAKTVTKTQPATARISNNFTKTQPAVARISNTRTSTQPATARIAKTVTKTQPATARIAVTATKTQPAIARIAVTVTKTQPAIARIANSRTSTQPAIARVAITATKTQPATARVAKNLTFTQTATARITVGATFTKTQTAVARIAVTATKTQPAVARIAVTVVKTQPATARIAKNFTKTQPAVARIANSLTKTQPATARIARNLTKTQPAVGRIAVTATKTQPVIARIANTRTFTQTATARIAVTAGGIIVTKTQTATARIAVKRTFTQTATASILTNIPAPVPKVILLTNGKLAMRVSKSLYIPL